MDACPFAEYLGQVTPARRVTCHPQNGIHEQAIVDTAAPPHPYPAGQMPFNPLPLLIGQHAFAHGMAPSPTLNQNRQAMEIL